MMKIALFQSNVSATNAALVKPEVQVVALGATIGSIMHLIPEFAALGAIVYYAVATYFMIKNKGR